MEDKPKHDITLRQADGPDVLDELKHTLADLFQQLKPALGESASNFVKGKGQQQVAKAQVDFARAQEIYGNFIEKIEQLNLDRQRLIQERDQVLRDSERKEKKADQKHEEAMFKLRTKRLKELQKVIKGLKAKSISIDVEIITKALYEIMQDQ